ncbi:MAG TPA: TetR/AcrR family transcriptional regulator [Candidatus Methylacidiphilales bacterium]
MPISSRTALKPRKQPRQERSQVTVDAIFEAAIQVLLAEGLERLTTIRVAERAGVSIGTLYQYYPNKQALLFAVLERHLARTGEAIGRAASAVHHTPIETMVAAVVDALVTVKTGRLDESRALYAVSTALNFQDLIRESGRKGRAFFAAMLETATDARFDDIETVAFVFMAALAGPMRVVIEGETPPRILHGLRRHLKALCLGYLRQEARPRSRKSPSNALSPLRTRSKKPE